MQEGSRLVALAIRHRLGYLIKSYLVLDFDRSRALGTYLPTSSSYGPGRSRTSR